MKKYSSDSIVKASVNISHLALRFEILTDSWVELGETFILEYSIYLDGDLELNDSIYMGAFSLEDQDFNTLGFTITPYMCNVMLNANLIGNSGGIIDSLSLSLNAPCEEQPQPDISAIYVYDKDWDFDHLIYSNGVNFYNTSGTEVNYTLPSSESSNENNVDYIRRRVFVSCALLF